MIGGVDHIVVLISSLADAVPTFERLGFTVERGGVHPSWRTENALAPLSDRTYLELLAPQIAGTTPAHRLWRRADGRVRRPGAYGGYALLSRKIADDVARLREHGVAVDGPSPGTREGPDGRTVRWRLAFPDRPDLPFLIEDETPRELRIGTPRGGLNVKASLAEVTIVTANVDEPLRIYTWLLDRPPVDHRETATGRTARFDVPGGRITLLSPQPGMPELAVLSTSGPGVAAITLAIRNWHQAAEAMAPYLRVSGDRADILEEATGGVRISLAPAPHRLPPP